MALPQPPCPLSLILCYARATSGNACLLPVVEERRTATVVAVGLRRLQYCLAIIQSDFQTDSRMRAN